MENWEHETEDCPFLSIFGQAVWNDTICIVGSKMALVKLRDMLNDIIARDNANIVEDDFMVASDREGYTVEVIKTPYNSAMIENVMTPYMDEAAGDCNENALSLEQMWTWATKQSDISKGVLDGPAPESSIGD